MVQCLAYFLGNFQWGFKYHTWYTCQYSLSSLKPLLQVTSGRVFTMHHLRVIYKCSELPKINTPWIIKDFYLIIRILYPINLTWSCLSCFSSLTPVLKTLKLPTVFCVAFPKSDSWQMWELFLGWEGCISLGIECGLTTKGRPHCLPGEGALSHMEQAQPFCLLHTALHIRKPSWALWLKGLLEWGICCGHIICLELVANEHCPLFSL